MSKNTIAEFEQGDECTLWDCPPGFFLFENSIHFKSEYSTDKGEPEAYCGNSGEFFWGGAKSHIERRALKVTPLEQVPFTAQNRAICAVEIFEDALRHLQLEIPGESVSWQDENGFTRYQTVSDFVNYVMEKVR
jgi:hypothetical protein